MNTMTRYLTLLTLTLVTGLSWGQNEKKVYPTAVTPIDLVSEARQLELEKNAAALSSRDNFMTAMSGGTIKNITSLPESGDLRVVQLDNDEMFLMTGNGRFMIKIDAMLDVWKSNRIKKPSDLIDVDKVSLEEMRLNVGTLGRYSYGSGHKMITIIHDPSDAYTKKLFQVLSSMEGDYVYRLLPVPSSNQSSYQHLAKFWCAVPFDKMFEFVLEAKSFEGLPMPHKECKVDPVQRNIALSSILQVKKLPYTIRHDGTHMTGLPATSDELVAWIKEGDK